MKSKREMPKQIIVRKKIGRCYYHVNKICNFLRFFKKLVFVILIMFILDSFFLPCFSFKLLKEQKRFVCDNFMLNEINSFPNRNEHLFRRSNCSHKNESLFKKKVFLSNKKFKVMSAKVDAIIESLKNLTLLEASELVKKIEVTFSVDTKQHVGVAKGAESKSENDRDSEEADNEDENRVYDLILENIEPNKKIPIIKIVKEIKKDLNLKQAKDLVDNLPQTLFEKINKETADQWKKKLTEAGGIVTLKWNACILKIVSKNS